MDHRNMKRGYTNSTAISSFCKNRCFFNKLESSVGRNFNCRDMVLDSEENAYKQVGQFKLKNIYTNLCRHKKFENDFEIWDLGVDVEQQNDSYSRISSQFAQYTSRTSPQNKTFRKKGKCLSFPKKLCKNGNSLGRSICIYVNHTMKLSVVFPQVGDSLKI